MLPKPLRMLWGDLTNEELKKFGILSSAMMILLGNYWMLRTTKNAVFDMFVGYRQYQPIVKLVSLLTMIFLVMAYSKLVDIMKKQNLILLFCIFYSLSFIAVGYAISNPKATIIQSYSIFYSLLSWVPGNIMGWVSYILLESYGSLLIALFYAFIASVMTTESAKKGYGMLMFLAQIGTVTGSTITAKYATSWGIDKLYILGGTIILIVPFIIRFYIKVMPLESIDTKQKAIPNQKTGFLEGLKLLLTRPYVMGILVVATTYEIIATIVEYQMNWIASGYYQSAGELATFNAYLGIGVNALALFFAFVGTSFFMRRFGLKFCLITYPIAISCIVISTTIMHYIGISNVQLMWVLLIAMIAIKGFNYSLNKPSSEVLYIPTTKDIKFKAKGWIDSFGGRSTKGIGSTISNTLKYSLPTLIIYGNIISLGIIATWVIIAALTGKKFQKLQKNNSFIE